MFFFFFFSSRRRHTRLQGDWSSDVCSSDLLLPDEPLRQIDVDDVVLAGDGVLQRIAAPFADALDAERALAAGALDGDLRLHEPGDLEGGPEQLPRQSAELAGEDLGEGLDLLVAGGVIRNCGSALA